MTVNTTHPRPDARLDSSRAGITPGARREEHRATARERPGTAPRRGACPRCPADAPRHAPRPPRRGRHPHRRARTEAEGSQARRPRAVASPGSTPPGPPAFGARSTCYHSRFARGSDMGSEMASPRSAIADPPMSASSRSGFLLPRAVRRALFLPYAYVTPPCPECYSFSY